MREPISNALHWTLVAFALLLALMMFMAASKCHQRDGAFVRGAIWYECVQAARSTPEPRP